MAGTVACTAARKGRGWRQFGKRLRQRRRCGRTACAAVSGVGKRMRFGGAVPRQPARGRRGKPPVVASARRHKCALAHLRRPPAPQVGAYEPATLLLARLTSLGMQPAAWQPLGTTLADTVLEELQPVLRALAPRGLAGQGLLDAAVLALAKVGAAGGGSAALRATLPAALPPGPPLSARAGEALLTLGPFLCRSPKLLNQVRDGKERGWVRGKPPCFCVAALCHHRRHGGSDVSCQARPCLAFCPALMAQNSAHASKREIAVLSEGVEAFAEGWTCSRARRR